MKKILLFLLLSLAEGLAPVSFVQGQESLTAPPRLSKKDMFQAEQWMRTARGFWEVGDYPMLQYYCLRIVELYPETPYAKEAKKFLKDTEKPSSNRRREYIRNNPALFPSP